MLMSPALLLRRKMMLQKLKACGAVTEESAVTLKEAGMFLPNAFPKLTQNLIDLQMINRTKDRKYYLNH